MNGKLKLVAGVLAMVLLLGGAWFLYGRLSTGLETDQLAPLDSPPPAVESSPAQSDAPAQSEPPQTVPAPDFTVYREDGSEVHLSDYLGKPVVLNFWASWCPPCQSEMPEFDEVYRELGEQVQFLMIDMANGYRGESVEVAAAFVAEKGYQFPVVYDTDSSAADAYGAYSLPTTFFIDAQGHGVAQAVGAINGETLRRGIDMILP